MTPYKVIMMVKLEVTPEFPKACRLAHQKYKSELENRKVAKKEDNVNRKRKLKQEEIQNVKKNENKMLKMLSMLSEKVSIVKY